jgi:putative ABC transport system permease protein
MMTVVGVSADTRYRDLREARPSVYIPIGQSPFPGAPQTLAIRTRRTDDAIIPALRATIADVNTGVALASARTVDDLLASPLAQPRLNATLLAVFALSARALAAVGLFGVMSASVRQRTGEIGIRMALGATSAKIGRLVMAQGVSVAAIGIPIGMALSAIGAMLLRDILYGVSPFDVVSFAVATLVLVAVAAVAAGLPALTSARIDPLVALRRDG